MLAAFCFALCEDDPTDPDAPLRCILATAGTSFDKRKGGSLEAKHEKMGSGSRCFHGNVHVPENCQYNFT